MDISSCPSPALLASTEQRKIVSNMFSEYCKMIGIENENRCSKEELVGWVVLIGRQASRQVGGSPRNVLRSPTTPSDMSVT